MNILPADSSVDSLLVGVDVGEGKEVEIPGKDEIVMDEAENGAKVVVKVMLVVRFKATSGSDVGKHEGEDED